MARKPKPRARLSPKQSRARAASRRAAGTSARGRKGPVVQGKAKRKTARDRQSRSRVRRSPERIEQVRAARRTLPLRKGPIRVSESKRWVGISRRGFDSRGIKRVLRTIAKHPGADFYSYTVKVRYRQRNGKMKKDTFPGIGVPTLRSAQRRRRKGESAEAALKRLVLFQVQRTINSAVRAEWGAYQLGDMTTPMGRAKARRMLRDVKRRERVSFQVEFFHEAANDIGTRQRRRRRG